MTAPTRIKTTVLLTTWWPLPGTAPLRNPRSPGKCDAATEHEIDPRSDGGWRKGVTAWVGGEIGFPRGDLGLDGQRCMEPI